MAAGMKPDLVSLLGQSVFKFLPPSQSTLSFLKVLTAHRAKDDMRSLIAKYPGGLADFKGDLTPTKDLSSGSVPRETWISSNTMDTRHHVRTVSSRKIESRSS